MKKSKVKIIDKTEIVILWGKVECPYCEKEQSVDSNEGDEIKCYKCRKTFICEWE